MPRRKTARSSHKSTSGKHPALRKWIVPGLSALLIVGVVIGGVLAPTLLHDRASQRLRQEPILVRFTWPLAPGETESWLAQSARNDLLTRAYDALDQHPDILSSRQLTAVAGAVKATGWFRGQPTVRRLSAREIEVSGDWRVPAVVARKGGRDYLIAWTGELLPMHWTAGESNLRAIVRPMFDPPGDAQGRLRFGEPWQGEDIRASLELFALLRTQPYWDQVRDIEPSPSRQAGRIELTIITDRDSRIVWGLRPSASGVDRGEPPTNVKLANLRELRERFGRIDAGRPAVAINTYNVVVPNLARSGAN